MKIYLHKLIVLLLVFLGINVLAQAPQKMSYQMVIRNTSNALVVNASVGIKISILQGNSSGTAVFVETHSVSTNANGLASLEIGGGILDSGNFSTISWANGPYFIKTETDPTGGTSYTITGTSELLSVPYAMYAGNANVGGFTHYIGESYLGGIIYHLYKGSDGLEHGLIVALTEGSGAWQNISTLIFAVRSWDGAYNTALMTDSPAATYIATLGPGWYLPSIDELGKLYYNRFEVNKALFTGGHTLLNGVYYWSSTVYNDTLAYSFFFVGGSAGTTNKTSVGYVRGIKAF